MHRVSRSLEENIFSLDGYKKRYGVTSEFPLPKVKEAFGKYCTRKIDLKRAEGTSLLSRLFEENSIDCWSELELELKSSPFISEDRLEHLSYLVHLSKEDLERFNQIRHLCLAKEYDKLNEIIPSVTPQFFSKIFFSISDLSTRLDLVKMLSSDEASLPYLDLIKTRDPLRKYEEKIAEIELELQRIPKTSFFKQYLIQRGVLNKQGTLCPGLTFSETWRNLLASLQFLKVCFGTTCESNSLIDWDKAISEEVYFRFCGLLEEAQKANGDQNWIRTLISIRDSRKNTTDEKIQKSEKALKDLKSFPYLQKLKDSLSFAVKEEVFRAAFESGPLASLNLGLVWDPSMPLLDQWRAKRDLEFLYVKTLIDLSLQKGLKVDSHFLHRCCNRGAFDEIQKAAEKIPQHEIKDAFEGKIRFLYEELASESSPHVPAYSLYRSFQTGFKMLYTSIKEQEKDSLYAMFLEEAYLNRDVQALLSMVKKEEATSSYQIFDLSTIPHLDCSSEELGVLIETLKKETAASSSSLSPATVSSMDCFAKEVVEDPKVFSFETLNDFWGWTLTSTSLFTKFIGDKGISRESTYGDYEPEVLELVHLARDLFIDMLRREAECMKEPFPAVITSLAELDEVSNTISYKKFLKGIDFFLQKTYKDSPFLLGLKKINQRSISIQEKRDLSAERLRTSSGLDPKHVKLLLDYLDLASSMPTKQAPVTVTEFSKAKIAECLNWISASSFKDSLGVEVDIKEPVESLQSALQAFKDKITGEINRLSIPSIYQDYLEISIQKGDVRALDRIWSEIAYRRYLHTIHRFCQDSFKEDRYSISQKMQSLQGLPICEVLREMKEFLKTIENTNLSNYLLLHLEKLPYPSKEASQVMDVKTQTLTMEYLRDKNATRPFYRHLKENQFTAHIWGKESFNWLASLYEQFVNNMAQEIRSSEYKGKGGELLLEEIQHLEPFDFSKLDQIAALVQKQKKIDLQKCCDEGFIWSIQKILAISLLVTPVDKVHNLFVRSFESIPTLEAQKRLLNYLGSSDLKEYLLSIVRLGGKRSLQAAYEFLKEKMNEQDITEYQFLSFFFESFFGYSSGEVLNAIQVQENAKTELESLEKWIDTEGSYSVLRIILEREGFLDSFGKVIPKFSYLYTLTCIEDCLQSVTSFLRVNISKYSIDRSGISLELDPKKYGSFDAMLSIASYNHFLASLPEGSRIKQECQTLYLAEESSWVKCLTKTKTFLEESSEEGITPTLLEDKIREMTCCGKEEIQQHFIFPALQNPDSGFSWYLTQLGIRPLEGVSAEKYYRSFMFWVDLVSRHLNEKIGVLEKERYEGTLRYPSILKTGRESLKQNLKDRNWQKVNEITDQITYTEYQIELKKLTFGANNSLLRKIQKQNGKQGSASELIVDAKENLAQLNLSQEDTERLRKILEKTLWVEEWRRKLGLDWSWISGSPLSLLPCFQKTFSEVSIYEAHTSIEQAFVSLAQFLKQEVKALEMNPLYGLLIERACYENDHSLWGFLSQEIAYEKYLKALQKAQEQGHDVTMLYELSWETADLTTEDKIDRAVNVLKRKTSTQCYLDLLNILNWKNLIGFVNV